MGGGNRSLLVDVLLCERFALRVVKGDAGAGGRLYPKAVGCCNDLGEGGCAYCSLYARGSVGKRGACGVDHPARIGINGYAGNAAVHDVLDVRGILLHGELEVSAIGFGGHEGGGQEPRL